jgi:hypothetical protein
MLLVEPISSVLWRTHGDLVVEVSGQTFTVPSGYVTDFATVPRIAVWLIPRFGAYTIAAVFHDWLLTHELPAGRVTAREADALFLAVLRDLKVPPYRRALMWTGVRYGSLFSRDSKRRVGWLADAPWVALYSTLFMLSVLPPLAMLVVAAALAVYAVFEGVASIVSDRDKPTAGSLST